MICPRCKALKNKVSNTRPHAGGKQVRRQRTCLKCGKIFYTIEMNEYELEERSQEHGNKEKSH